MERLTWELLGYGIFPLWLLAGVLDYALHQRTSIATTAGPRESRLHVAQMLQVGGAVLLVLFVELDRLALALIVAAAVAHTVTAYWDVRYASERRVILPLEQVVHAFLITLPLISTALLVLLHWSAVHTPGFAGLRWRAEPWDRDVVVTVLVTSAVFGMLPSLLEYWQTSRSSLPSRREVVAGAR